MSADPISHVRVLAQSDPVPNLTAEWGIAVNEARSRISDLEAILRELDRYRAALAERNVHVSEDLGPIGNAAAAARRDLNAQPSTTTFKLPT